MDKLQKLLTEYNNKCLKKEFSSSWSNQYCQATFPKYWYEVFNACESLNKHLRVLEVGAGQGDITSILCYLGFKNIIAFERDKENASLAQEKLKHLFSANSIIRNENFPTSNIFKSDILILVNCVYADGIRSKKEYLDQIKLIYSSAGSPSIFIFEVIDAEYDAPDEIFPFYVRLSKNDILDLFPSSDILGIRTYQYPENKKTKTLYIIKIH